MEGEEAKVRVVDLRKRRREGKKNVCILIINVINNDNLLLSLSLLFSYLGVYSFFLREISSMGIKSKVARGNIQNSPMLRAMLRNSAE